MVSSAVETGRCTFWATRHVSPSSKLQGCPQHWQMPQWQHAYGAETRAGAAAAHVEALGGCGDFVVEDFASAMRRTAHCGLRCAHHAPQRSGPHAGSQTARRAEGLGLAVKINNRPGRAITIPEQVLTSSSRGRALRADGGSTGRHHQTLFLRQAQAHRGLSTPYTSAPPTSAHSTPMAKAHQLGPTGSRCQFTQRLAAKMPMR